MQTGGGECEGGAGANSPSDDREDPEGCRTDVCEGLERIGQEDLPEDIGGGGSREQCPCVEVAARLVPEKAYEHEEEAASGAAGHGEAAAGVLFFPQEHETQGHADGEEELGHDGVCIAAPCVVMPEQGRGGLVVAEEVHEKHCCDGVSTKLIEGRQAWLRRGRGGRSRAHAEGAAEAKVE